METWGDPAADPRARYDYRSDDVARRALEADLDGLIAGDVRLDSYTRSLYATDASIYEVTPVGVVFPRSVDDVAAVMDYCATRQIPVLPRGGGTSLAGQAVNEAVVLDFTRYMDDISRIDPDARTATVEPGVILGTLNDRAGEYALQFAPDPAWADKSTIGGAIGNNSTGAHSLQFGKTDAYIESCQVVLADGTVTRFGEVSVETLRSRADPSGDLEARIYAEVARILEADADAIEDAYPDLLRNVSGYNLDRLVAEARGVRLPGGESGGEPGTINLARLLAGSEGTLAIVTEATVSLVERPVSKAVALLCYDDLRDAMTDVSPILEHDPAAVEVLDDVLIGLARETPAFVSVAERLPPDAAAALLVEFFVADEAEGQQRVADLLADRCPAVEPTGEPTGESMADPHDEPTSKPTEEPTVGRTARESGTRDLTTGDSATDSSPVDGDSGTPASGPSAPGPVAIDAIEAYSPEARSELWSLRKSGLPILLSRTSDEKHIAFVEDLAVPPDRLPEFVTRFGEILETHDTTAAFYAHAGPGVLHVRPLLDTKTEAGVEMLYDIADAATDLAIELGGSVSGEHGDGRARSVWNRKLYGADVYRTFRSLKSAFDPDWLLNPGQVVGLEGTVAGPEGPDEGTEMDEGHDGASEGSQPEAVECHAFDGTPPDRTRSVDPRQHLRFDPDYEFDPGFEPVLEWGVENGMQGMVELCHGCGGCRGLQSTTGGVMCPTYRASREEITSTRGRANALRRAMSGRLPAAELFSEQFRTEVLDLCISCKGCAHDCPSGVDLAKLKAEVTHEAHRRHGASLRDRLFARVDTLCRLGSLFAPVSNWFPRVPGARLAMQATLGIATETPLPEFTRRTFRDRLAERDGGPDESTARRRALVYPDPITQYVAPSIGLAAVDVLEAAAVHVAVAPGSGDSGRPAYSLGFLDRARSVAQRNVDELGPMVEDGWDVIVLEPSDAVMLQSDYHDFALDGPVDALSAATYGPLEYVDRFGLDEHFEVADAAAPSLTYHAHCHQKATGVDHHAPTVLRRVGYDVDVLESGCCGMAGSFGFEAEHASMSRAIGEILFEQVRASEEGLLVAPGDSCRTQLRRRPDADGGPITPIEAVARRLP